MNTASHGSSHAHGTYDDAALRGASLAFRKRTSPSSTAPSHTHSISHSPNNGISSHAATADHSREGNEALTAATSSAERAKTPAGVGASWKTTGSTPEVDLQAQNHYYSHQAGLVAARLQQLGSSSTTSPSHHPSLAQASHASQASSPHAYSATQVGLGRSSMESARLDAKNPSLIAATLAASRSTSTSPIPKGHAPRRVGSLGAIGALNLDAAIAAPITVRNDDDDTPVDAASMPPTESLISMFEATNESKNSSPRIVVRQSPMSPHGFRSTSTSAASTPVKPKPKPKPQRSAHESEGTASTAATSSGHGSGQGEKDTLAKQQLKPLPVVSKSVLRGVSPKPLKTTIVSSAASTPPVRRQSKPAMPNTNTLLTNAGSPATTTTPKRSNTTATTPSKPKQKPAVPARSPSLHLVQPKTPVASPNVSTPAASTADLPKLDTTPKRLTSPTPRVISHSTPEVLSPRPTRVAKHTLRTTTPPPPMILKPSSDVMSPPSPSPKKRSQVENTEKEKPAATLPPPPPPQPRKSQRFVPDRSRSRPRGLSDTKSPPKPVNSMYYGLPIPGRNMKSASPPQEPPPISKQPTPRRESIATAPPSPTHEVPRRRFTQSSAQPPQNGGGGMQLNSLTNAIMAGSLASSRLTPHNTGPSMPPPPLPKRHKSPRLLQTLRRPPSVTEEDEERSRKANHHHHHRHKLRSSKHVHHEGSRKRWRDKITERERKRYEAIWASNRGLLLTNVSPSASVGSGIGTDLHDCVVNVVVREIWTRSRLPDDELAEIWDLVDRTSMGYLTRQEFVVGMWLIDQCLRGRKLPVKVSESIWGSVNGVTVLKPRRR